MRTLYIRTFIIKFYSRIWWEKAMATHSSTLAWKIPWTEEPGGPQFMGSLRVGHDWATSLSLFTFMHWRRKWQPTPVFLPGESQGRGSLMGCHLWGHTVGHNWATSFHFTFTRIWLEEEIQYSCQGIPWSGEPGRLQSMRSQKVGHTEQLSSKVCRWRGKLLSYWKVCRVLIRFFFLLLCFQFGRKMEYQ